MPNPTVEVKFELFDQITSGLKNINEAMGGFKKSMVQLSNYIDETGKKFFFMNQLAEGMDRFNQSVKQFAAPGADFQQQMADLSAITGMVGTDLEKISASSRQVGKDSGLGASAAAEAYKLLASNIDWTKIGIEGLQQLQKDTVTLTQASGIDMATAADVMAGAINQFGLQATESTRIINVLGAGAKFGAAEIADLGASLKVAGTTAALAGVPIEGVTGAIEVMSQSMIKGEQAGTYLRNIILKLQTENIPGIDLKTQGLSGSLEALKPKLNDVTWLTKTFGMENVNAAQILISQSDAVKEMTDKVTGTNTAMEQAKTRTNTYNYAMMRVKATMDDMKISVFNVTGSFLPWVEVLSQGVGGIARTLPGLKVMKDGFVFLGGALKTGAIGLINYVKGLGAAREGIVATTVVQRILNTVMKANPYILAAMALIALGTALIMTSRKIDTVADSWKALKESQQSVFDDAIKERANAEELYKTARDLNLTYEERHAALVKLQEIAPQYFKDFDDETIKTQAASQALTDYINNLDKAAAEKAIFNQKVANREARIKSAQSDEGFRWSNADNYFFGIGKSNKQLDQEYYDQQDKFLTASYENLRNAYSGNGKSQNPNGQIFKPQISLPKLNYGTGFKPQSLVPQAVVEAKPTKTQKPSTPTGNKPPKTLKSPSDNINEVSGKASVKNIYINMEAGLKIGTISHQGDEDMDTFISKMRTALNLVLNDANYLAG